nr:immunoglobulin light chain junction region [Macaca mulatta]MOX17886.1 immunoglobulin light chain junction region [Macaca mulatta]MOX17991.1 immunoglobulin light chain junction region [Macaca mulatta]MOX18129.1 immunoglobulin light chain junction region [Macaca mulatta]MOX19434.1 immunoglobulin light chain junction region [Macaca mulatta]
DYYCSTWDGSLSTHVF